VYLRLHDERVYLLGANIDTRSTGSPILGAQEVPGRLEGIQDEWRLNTKEKVQAGDPAVYALLTNPEYKFPTVLPDAEYRAKTFTIQEYK